MLQVHTRGGLFGPGGYGGGIFDGSQMGFGGLGRSEQVGYGIGDTAPGGGFQWCSKVEPCKVGDPRVKALQTALNTGLKAHGFKLLTVDGKLGAGTCGATAWAGTLPENDPMWNIAGLSDLMASLVGSSGPVCKTFTYPTPVGSTKPFIPPNTFKSALAWQEINPEAATVQKNLNGDLVAHGYDPIAESGMLDAPTCGAMRVAHDQWGMDYLSEYGSNCQAFQAPSLHAMPVTPHPAPAPDERKGETVYPPVRKKSGVTAAWMIGGLAVAAGVAGIYAASKKRR
jgi:hypothetical protein